MIHSLTKPVGVLALQGAFAKHAQCLQTLDVNVILVRTPQELEKCAGLIIPGGESTTMTHQLKFQNMIEPLSIFSKHRPVFGTCAGLILMARSILDFPGIAHFNLLDIEVERNAYGRQSDSFQTSLTLNIPEHPFKETKALFIRAPRISILGKNVKVLASFKDEPVLVEQGMHLGAAFHPELSEDLTVHRYFLSKM